MRKFSQTLFFATTLFIFFSPLQAVAGDAGLVAHDGQAAQSCQKMLNTTVNTWSTAEHQWRTGYAGCRAHLACWQRVAGQMRQDANRIQSQKNLLIDSSAYGVIDWRQGHYFVNTQRSALQFFRYAMAYSKVAATNPLQKTSQKELLQHVHRWRLQTDADMDRMECWR